MLTWPGRGPSDHLRHSPLDRPTALWRPAADPDTLHAWAAPHAIRSACEALQTRDRRFMATSRRIVLGLALALGGLTLAVTGVSGQTGSNLPGIDISHWQGTINWTSVKSSGVVFAFCKAT